MDLSICPLKSASNQNRVVSLFFRLESCSKISIKSRRGFIWSFKNIQAAVKWFDQQTDPKKRRKKKNLFIANIEVSSFIDPRHLPPIGSSLHLNSKWLWHMNHLFWLGLECCSHWQITQWKFPPTIQPIVLVIPGRGLLETDQFKSQTGSSSSSVWTVFLLVRSRR